MELYEFSLLPISDKGETLWENGEFIISLKEGTLSYSLYSLFGYFVEVNLCNTENQIIDIRPFKKGEILDKYLEFIKLD